MWKGRAKVIMALLMWNVVCGSASATENGLMTYPNGVNTVLNGVLPKPGDTRFYNYSEYYIANTFVGDDGASLIPDFKVSVFAEAPRIVHTWGKGLGPFSAASGIIVPVLHVSLDAAGTNSKKTGLGDIILQPLFIGYSNSKHTFFAFAVTDVGVPTGAYSRNSAANTGVNYYSFWPNIDLTWFPTRNWEASVSALAEFHTKNAATDYQSGAVAEVDYHVGYSIRHDLQLGVQGYFIRQFSDDKVGGAKFLNGFRGRANAVGPQLRYDLKPGVGFVLKFQKEFQVENRARGQKIWIQFSAPL
jgi:hypothetical protein